VPPQHLPTSGAEKSGGAPSDLDASGAHADAAAAAAAAAQSFTQEYSMDEEEAGVSHADEGDSESKADEGHVAASRYTQDKGQGDRAVAQEGGECAAGLAGGEEAGEEQEEESRQIARGGVTEDLKGEPRGEVEQASPAASQQQQQQQHEELQVTYPHGKEGNKLVGGGTAVETPTASQVGLA